MGLFLVLIKKPGLLQCQNNTAKLRFIAWEA